MTPLMYLEIFVIGLLGAILHSLFKIKSIQDKARLANVAFKPIDYWKEDWVSHLTSLCTILMCMFFVTDVIAVKPDAVPYVRASFGFIGYVGNDIASRVFGAVNTRVNKVIDEKTTKADTADNNTQPTPHK